MAENSKISWTDHTFNPWRGCAKVSPGCKHCYAETFVTGRQGLPLWGVDAERKVAADSTWKEPLRWQKKARAEGRRARVFCASLADVFEPRPDLVEPRRRLFQLIEGTRDLDWLLLTKRPEAMLRLADEAGWSGAWPENVWAGTTVENQEMADERIPRLLEVPARIRFLSCEPLLGPVQLTCLPANLPILSGSDHDDYFDALRGRGYDPQLEELSNGSYPRISWVITGGESGPGARPFDIAWARALRDQCAAAGTAYFFKQTGARAVDDSIALRFKDRAGADPAEWPADLRVREWPR